MQIRKLKTIKQSLKLFGILDLYALVFRLRDVKEHPCIHGEGTVLAHIQLLYDNLPQIVDCNILLAAIFHDIGKYGSKENGFEGHEEKGYNELKNRLPEGNYDREKILWIVRRHGDFLIKSLAELEMSHPYFPDTLLVFYYDSISRVPPSLDTFVKAATRYVRDQSVDSPESAAFHLTQKCNLNCVTCYSVFTRIESKRSESDQVIRQQILPDLPLKTLSSALADLRILGTENVILFGGEPFTRTDLDQIIGLCISYGFNPEIVSNGTLITKDGLQKLQHVGLKKIALSIDGIEQGHRKIRGDSSYKKAVQAIWYAKELGLQVRVNTLVTKRNQNTIVPLMQELLDVIDVHKILYFTPFGRGEKELWMRPGEWMAFCKKLQHEFESYGGKTRVVVEKTYRKMSGDVCWQVHPVIRTDGNLYPCVMFIGSERLLGNINETRFLEIWTNTKNWELVGQRNAHCVGYNYIFKGDINHVPPQIQRFHKQNEIKLTCPVLSYELLRLDGKSIPSAKYYTK